MDVRHVGVVIRQHDLKSGEDVLRLLAVNPVRVSDLIGSGFDLLGPWAPGRGMPC